MSNPTLKDAGKSNLLVSILIELRDDGACTIETNANNPLVFARVMGDALSIKMNQFLEQAHARAALAGMQHPLTAKLATLPRKEN